MTVATYTDASEPRQSTLARWGMGSARRLIVAAAGCAVMALSGGGLAGYLDLSSATAADASTASVTAIPADAPSAGAPQAN